MLNISKKIFFLSFLVFIFIFPFIIRAQINFQPNINVPGFQETQVQGDTIAKYISSFYKWSVIAIAIFAVLMIVNAGFGMVLNSGNVAKVTEKRDELFRAIIGLMLALITVPFLQMINPALSRLSNLSIAKISYKEMPNSTSVESYVLGPYGVSKDQVANWEKITDVESDLNFCLYGSQTYPGIDENTGKGKGVGGSRGIAVAIYFPDNSRREAVAVKGTWKLKGGQKTYSLCGKEDGCGGGEENWGASIDDNLSQDECMVNGGFDSNIKTCSKVTLWNPTIFSWAGDRGSLNDPNLETQQYGNFEVDLEILSKRNEFSSQKDVYFFTQRCGLQVPVCNGGQRTGQENKCCKKAVGGDSNNFYYDFCVTAESSCPYEGIIPRIPESEASRYCGI